MNAHNSLVNGTQGNTTGAAKAVSKIGKLISSQEGKCKGPCYGQIYTAPAGEKGYVAGYRSFAVSGQGLMGIENFATLKAAQDYAVTVSDN